MVNQGPSSPGGHYTEVALDSGKRPFLMVVGGSNEVVTVAIKGPSVTLGRDRNRDVFVDEPTVSRNHAEIRRDNDGCRLRDLNSKNGTFVNRRNIGAVPYRLNDGDEIRLGTSFMVLIFRDVADGTDGSSPKQAIHARLTEDSESLVGDGARTTKSVVWSSLRANDVAGDREALAGSASEMYAGTVRLKVTVEDDSQCLSRLLEVLSRDPKLVLLQVESDSPSEADICLTLWEPLPLLSVLASLDHVTSVSPMEEEVAGDIAGARLEGRERVISVRLSSNPRMLHSS
jgi:hypothetical protein